MQVPQPDGEAGFCGLGNCPDVHPATVILEELTASCVLQRTDSVYLYQTSSVGAAWILPLGTSCLHWTISCMRQSSPPHYTEDAPLHLLIFIILFSVLPQREQFRLTNGQVDSPIGGVTDSRSAWVMPCRLFPIRRHLISLSPGRAWDWPECWRGGTSVHCCYTSW
ncbi:uncharacterized [Lates japonicus]